MITYDDFAKLEITIGADIAVALVEGADKLLQLTVDFGEEKPRQIISGIRTYVAQLESLVGMRCPFLTNLAPRTIRGLVSEGMLLAAHADDTFAFLLPSTDIPPGTRVV